jgi:hypothetical protein
VGRVSPERMTMCYRSRNKKTGEIHVT